MKRGRYSIIDQQTQKRIATILLGISILVLIITTVVGMNNSIWLDETFSLNAAKLSYRDIVALAAKDCHPPLYHIMLKIFLNVVIFFNANVNMIIAGKVFSIIPLYLIIIIFNLYMKSKISAIQIGIFDICIVMMPNILGYALQIRMYSWALFFVTMEFLAIYAIIYYQKKVAWGVLVFFALAASYTHYFACVSSGLLIFLLFIYQVSRDKKKLKYWGIIIILIFLGFSPWISNIVKVMLLLYKNGFWIKPISVQSLIGYIWFVFFPQIYKFHSSGILGCIFCLILLYSFTSYLRSKENSKQQKFVSVIGPLCLIGTLLVGIVISILITPVFSDRFLYPSFGCLWFCVCTTIVNIENDRLKLVFCTFIILLGVINGYDTISTEITYQQNLSQYESVLNDINIENTVFLSDSFHIACCTSYYNEIQNRDADSYLWVNKAETKLVTEGYHNLFYRLDNIDKIESVKKMSKEEKNILFLENIGYNSDFIEKCKTNNMIVQLLGTYRIEDRVFNLYKVK